MGIRARRLLPAVVMVVALCLPAVAAAQTTAAGEVTLHGRYFEVYVEGAQARVAASLSVGARSYRLRFTSGHKLRSGQLVRVTGRLTGDLLTVRESAVEGASAAAVATTGPVRALVVLAHWSTPDAVTPATAADVVFRAGGAWFREVSYGRASLVGDVTPWVRVPAPPNCDTNALTNSATAAARAAGFDPARYDRTVIYFPKTSACGFSAMGGVGWGISWLNGRMQLSTVVHELGHNYGLSHAHALWCTSAGAPVALSATCRSEEYGDLWDAMGYSRPDGAGHYNAAQKDRLGWTTGRKRVVTTSGEYTLAPYEAGGVAVQSLAVSAGGRTYWMEFRQPRGVDTYLRGFSGATNGVVVHTPAARGSDLLDLTPGSRYGMADSALPVGRSWVDPTGKLRLTVRAAGATGARVAVAIAGSPAPAPAPPVTPPAAGQPAVIALSSTLHAPGTLRGSSVPVRLGWSAVAAQGVCGQALAHEVNGRAVAAPVLGPSAREVVHAVPPGASRWNLTTRDCAGAEASGRAVATLTTVEDRGIGVRGAWRRPAWPAYSGGAALTTTARGASASIRFTGRSVGWVATTGPLSGSARILVDGIDQGRVDLRSTAVGARAVVWSRAWPTARPRTLTIIAEGTPGRPRVTVDAITTLT